MKMTPEAFLKWNNKVVTLVGMSGVGKTTLGSRLPLDQWFHYSCDYRIGTRYLEEPILDNIKREAMKVPFLRDLILSDSIYIRSNITVDHLKPLSTFMGKLGAADQGGLTYPEFIRRQRLHRAAELASVNDIEGFRVKARELYQYPHFLIDTGGSICEFSSQEVWTNLAEQSLIIYLTADSELEKIMLERAKEDPKPLYYNEQFLEEALALYLKQEGFASSDDIHSDSFLQWVFPKLVNFRKPVYSAIAENHGYSLDANTVAALDANASESDVLELVASALEAQSCR